MIHEHINLKEFFPKLKNEVILDTYCPDNFKEFSIGRKRKCILILPGGGYVFISEREAEPIALSYVGEDIATFVLHYTIGNFEFPYPMIEVFAALKYIKDHADYYHIDENRIGLMGFSAGGHLAAITANECKNKKYLDLLGFKENDVNVKVLLLGYPVVTMKGPTHIGSRDQICKGNEELLEELSVERHVRNDFPPTFIWTTCKDSCVPPSNSLDLANALIKKGISVELHLYPHGDHGLALANKNTVGPYNKAVLDDVHTWVKNSYSFLELFL